MREKTYEPGDYITLRIPKDTTAQDLHTLNEFKRNTRGREFNKKALSLFFKSLQEQAGHNTITLPLPQDLPKEAQEQLNNPLVRQLLSQIVGGLLLDPNKAIPLGGLFTGIVEEPAQEEEKPIPKETAAAKFAAANLDLDDDD